MDVVKAGAPWEEQERRAGSGRQHRLRPSSLLTVLFGWHPRLGVCLELLAQGDNVGLAGWYNLLAACRLAAASSRSTELLLERGEGI